MPNTIPNDIKIVIAISSSSKSSKRESISEISQLKLCENKVAIKYAFFTAHIYDKNKLYVLCCIFFLNNWANLI